MHKRLHLRLLFLTSLTALTLLAVSLIAPRAARADTPSLDGKWKQGPLREEYTVQQWLPGCGPAPVSATTGGGDVVTIRVEGDELAFVGGGRVFRTNECYDQLPTLSRDAHTRDPSGRSWTTRCATPASDPRRATMNTRVDITGSTHIELAETGRYEISLQEGRCVADVKRGRSYDLVLPDVAPTATATAAPTATATAPARPAPCSPGDPARLEVRPSRKLMRPGESFAFRAVVTDASGCPTGTPTSWALGDGARGLTLERNKVTVAADAPEGTSELVVSAVGKSVRVAVEVASAARYDDLLASQGLNASGESDAAATAQIAGSTIGGGDARAEDNAKKKRTIFIAVVGAVVVLLGIVALVYFRRTKRAARLEKEQVERHAERVREIEERNRAKAEAHAAQLRAHEESVEKAKRAAQTSGTMTCPTCKREYPPPAGNFCPQDATRLVPLTESPGGPAGGVCPVCRRGFAPGVKVCPTDREELVPYAALPGVAPGAVSPKGKICPTCGGRFEGAATFCGKDGTALVLLN